jgi:hypothetical protein
MIDIALRHKVGDATYRAYMKSDMLEKRRRWMVKWSTFATSSLG